MDIFDLSQRLGGCDTLEAFGFVPQMCPPCRTPKWAWRASLAKGAQPSGCRDVLNSRTSRSSHPFYSYRTFQQPEGRVPFTLILIGGRGADDVARLIICKTFV